MRALRAAMGAALLAAAGASGVIFDPKSMDAELRACNATEPDEGDASCGADRACRADPQDAGSMVCLHKQLFPLSLRDVLGGICLFCGLTLAASAGIGGGGLNVPILLLVFDFKMDEAVVLSNAAVMGNGLAQLAVNARRRHPADSWQTLIDWDAVLVLLPAQVAGGNVGVVVGTLFPTTALYVMSMLLLAIAALKTFAKAREQHKLEAAATPADAEAEVDGRVPFAAIVPWTNIRVVFGFVVLFSLDSVLLNGLGTVKCSPTYWVVLLALYPLVFATVWWSARYMVARDAGFAFSEARDAADELFGPSGRGSSRASSGRGGDGYLRLAGEDARSGDGPPAALRRTTRPSGDVDWAAHCRTAPALALAIGAISAVLGLGGGELLGPVLLAVGMPARRSSATTATNSLLSTVANFTHYAAKGDLRIKNFLPYAIAVCLVGVAGGFAGRLAALHVAKCGRGSIIALALGLVLAISFGLMLFDTAASKPDLSFHAFC
ncbi:hypothetical protein M885DRAFT_509283 [Pelagophyceae sp. CCMP2097]|nr:hypothetical protein M885DRAFT_509283 [Pelagophyceae sp. CCMP2097]